MPNPLVRKGLARPRNVRHETPIEPEPETYYGQNYAYRGTQDHGVPGKPVTGPPEWTEHDGTETDIHDVPEPDPIPVRIVDHSRREVQTFVTDVQTVDTVTMIVGKNPRRTKLVFRNSGPGTVFIGPDAGVSSIMGYPIPSGTSFVDLPSETAVYAVADQPSKLSIIASISL